MRLKKMVVVGLLAAILAAPGSAWAVDWAEWKRLVRERPVAVVLIIPPMILTSPFMLATWAFKGSDDSE